MNWFRKKIKKIFTSDKKRIEELSSKPSFFPLSEEVSDILLKMKDENITALMHKKVEDFPGFTDEQKSKLLEMKSNMSEWLYNELTNRYSYNLMLEMYEIYGTDLDTFIVTEPKEISERESIFLDVISTGNPYKTNLTLEEYEQIRNEDFDAHSVNKNEDFDANLVKKINENNEKNNK